MPYDTNLLNPLLAYNQGYPHGYEAGKKALADGVSQDMLPEAGKAPSETIQAALVKPVPVPQIDPQFEAEWIEAFKQGWYEGFWDAYHQRGYPTPIDEPTANQWGYNAGLPLGYAQRLANGPGLMPEESPPGTITGHGPPPGWSMPHMSSYNKGFSEGWMIGYYAADSAPKPSPDPNAGAHQSWPFRPVLRPPIYPFVPFYPQNAAGAEQSGSGGEPQKSETTSYTPWIIGGLLAVASVGGVLYMRSRPKANPINQRDYKFYVVVGDKIESGWDYREDAKDQVAWNLPPMGAKILTRRTLVSRGIDPNDDANWANARPEQF